EDLSLVLDVTNTGTGKAMGAYATIKNVSDPNVFIEKGRFTLGELAPGETKTARFFVDLKRGFQGDSFPLKLAIVFFSKEALTTEKIELQVQVQPTVAVESR